MFLCFIDKTIQKFNYSLLTIFQCILSDINESKLSFEVYDKDMIGVDDTIGCAFVNLSKKPSIVVRVI
jgi:hypothetical protein